MRSHKYRHLQRNATKSYIPAMVFSMYSGTSTQHRSNGELSFLEQAYRKLTTRVSSAVPQIPLVT